MIGIVMAAVTIVIFIGLSQFNQFFNKRVNHLANELVNRKFNTIERDLIKVLDAEEMNDIPFDTNRIRMVVSIAGYFNNEYFFLVTYKDRNSVQRKAWVRIEFLFRKIIAYEEIFV